MKVKGVNGIVLAAPLCSLYNRFVLIFLFQSQVSLYLIDKKELDWFNPTLVTFCLLAMGLGIYDLILEELLSPQESRKEKI